MRHIFLAFTNPVSGNEDAYNEWYDATHVPEVLRYGRGFVGCQRFKFNKELQAGAIPPWQYVVIYDLLYEDLAGLAQSPWIPGSPRLTSFRGLIDDDHVGWTFTPRALPPEVRASQPPPSRQAAKLLFGWSTARIGENAVARAALDTPGCSAARLYDLAEHQRRGQLDCPWQGLVIFELARSDAVPPVEAFTGAWRFSAISPYVARSET